MESPKTSDGPADLARAATVWEEPVELTEEDVLAGQAHPAENGQGDSGHPRVGLFPADPGQIDPGVRRGVWAAGRHAAARQPVLGGGVDCGDGAAGVAAVLDGAHRHGAAPRADAQPGAVLGRGAGGHGGVPQLRGPAGDALPAGPVRGRLPAAVQHHHQPVVSPRRAAAARGRLVRHQRAGHHRRVVAVVWAGPHPVRDAEVVADVGPSLPPSFYLLACALTWNPWQNLPGGRAADHVVGAVCVLEAGQRHRVSALPDATRAAASAGAATDQPDGDGLARAQMDAGGGGGVRAQDVPVGGDEPAAKHRRVGGQRVRAADSARAGVRQVHHDAAEHAVRGDAGGGDPGVVVRSAEDAIEVGGAGGDPGAR
ncbi:hypothetical protein LOY94_006811, partial [Ophidiomyces ophidiicola]